MLAKDGPDNTIFFGSVDTKTTKKGLESRKRKAAAASKLVKQKARESNNFKTVDPFSENIELESNFNEHVEQDPTNYNFMSLKNVAQEADRYNMSSSQAAAIVNATLLDIKYITESDKDMVVTVMKVHNARKRYRKERVSENDENNRGNVELVGFDGKKTDGLCIENGKKRKLCKDYISFTNDLGQYLTHCVIEGRSTAVNIASELLTVLKTYESENIVKAIASDGTKVNTGHLAGVIVLAEQELGRQVHWLVCLLHENELPLR